MKILDKSREREEQNALDSIAIEVSLGRSKE